MTSQDIQISYIPYAYVFLQAQGYRARKVFSAGRFNGLKACAGKELSLSRWCSLLHHYIYIDHFLSVIHIENCAFLKRCGVYYTGVSKPKTSKTKTSKAKTSKAKTPEYLLDKSFVLIF